MSICNHLNRITVDYEFYIGVVWCFNLIIISKLDILSHYALNKMTCQEIYGNKIIALDLHTYESGNGLSHFPRYNSWAICPLIRRTIL